MKNEEENPNKAKNFVSVKDAPDFIANPDHVGFSTTKMLLDTPPSKHYKITYSVVKPFGFADEHSHPWDHAYFILEGRARIRVGVEEREVREGSLIYVPPNEKHAVKNIQGKPLVVLAIVGPEGEYKIK
ncbi:MAG TPA: cupin domain-containing protein [Nitrososphaerales archaeon]|nr:cupin domain-containing protein [Nitrososphaerales archaeon]